MMLSRQQVQTHTEYSPIQRKYIKRILSEFEELFELTFTNRYDQYNLGASGFCLTYTCLT